MPVKNIECQIAEMQIGRHVSGEPLSEEALGQLEAHLSKCLSCSRVLADRRHALRSMLHQGYAAVTTDVPTHHKEHLLIQALRDKADTASKRAPRPAVEADPQPVSYKKWSIDSLTKLTRDSVSSSETTISNGHVDHPANSLTKSYGKPLLLSAALAVVLFFMGYLSHGQSSLLGNTAASAYPDQAPLASNSHPSSITTQAPAKPNKASENLYGLNAPSETTKPSRPPSSASLHSAPLRRENGEGTAAALNSNKADSPTLEVKEVATKPLAGEARQDKAIRSQRSSAKKAPRRQPERRIERVRHHPAPVRMLQPTNRITIYDESGNPLAG